MAVDKDVTSEIYSNLADCFKSVYTCFCPKTERLDSDGKTKKISSTDDIVDEDAVEQKKLKDSILVLKNSVILLE